MYFRAADLKGIFWNNVSAFKGLREKQTHKHPASATLEKCAPDGLPHELFSEKNGTRSRANDDELESSEGHWSRSFPQDHSKSTIKHSRLPKLLSGLTSSVLYTLYSTGHSAQDKKF